MGVRVPLGTPFRIVGRRLRSSHRLKSDDIPHVTMASSCALTARTDRESRVGKKRILSRIVKNRVPISQLNKVQRRSDESGTGMVAGAGLDINDQYFFGVTAHHNLKFLCGCGEIGRHKRFKPS